MLLSNCIYEILTQDTLCRHDKNLHPTTFTHPSPAKYLRKRVIQASKRALVAIRVKRVVVLPADVLNFKIADVVTFV